MNARQQRLPVPAPLRPWICGIDVAAYSPGDGCALIHAPDPATMLVWRATAGDRGSALAVGPRTHASYHDGKDIPVCVRFRIRPGAAPVVLGTPAGGLVDRVVPLGELWGPLGDRLAGDPAGPDPALVAERLGAAVLSRVARERPYERDRARLIRAAAVELSGGSAGPAARVRDAARRVGVSERQLRNIFAATIGVSPKQFARLSRVRAVLGGLRHRSWAGLAGEAGYYDQSHMAAEFRRVMGVTPSAFAAGRLPALPC